MTEAEDLSLPYVVVFSPVKAKSNVGGEGMMFIFSARELENEVTYGSVVQPLRKS